MPAILVVAPEPSLAPLLEALAEHDVPRRGLTNHSEVPASLDQEAPGLLVVDGSLLATVAKADWFHQPTRMVVVLVSGAQASELENLEHVRALDATLPTAEVARRLALAHLGIELGIQPDATLESLVGDVGTNPVLEVVRSLCRRSAAAEITLDGGIICVANGDVVAARSRRATAIKAFCRLARRRTGTLFIRVTSAAPREIGMGLEQLLLRALDDAQETPPNPRSALKPRQRGLHRASGLLDYQRELLVAVEEAPTVGDLLDALPWPDGLIALRLQRLVEAGLVQVEKPRNAVTVVTDSTCDLPGRLVRRLGIQVIPLTVSFGKDQYLDGVEIQPARFYELLGERAEQPRTDPPDADTFAVAFAQKLVDQDVVAVHLSSKLSLTSTRAREGAALALEARPRPGAAVEVIDTGTLSTGTGLLAIAAARLAERGLDVHAIAERVRAMAPRIHTLFVVDTLDSLVRGGRIGATRGLVGKLLGTKPILGVVDGQIAAVDKSRGSSSAHARMVELLAARLDPRLPVIAAVGHAKAPVAGEHLRTLLAARFDLREVIVSDMGPVIGTHTGPGAVGVAMFQPTDEEWPLLEPGPDEIDADDI